MNSSFASIAGIAIHVDKFQRATKYLIQFYLEINSRTSPKSLQDKPCESKVLSIEKRERLY